MKRIIFLFFIVLSLNLFSQEIATPLQKNNFSKVTSYSELTEYVDQLDQISDLLKVEVIGNSVEGKNVYAMLFSSAEFGVDKTKVKVLILAQQHGNEQSGKEGALLLAQTILKPENKYLLDRIDLAIVPQMNPDGSEQNKRRNGADVDLNRNHLIMSEPETKAIHQLFSRYLFEVTLDIHEYWPYGEEWAKFGYRKNFDVTFGAITNTNVDVDIRELSDNTILPYLFKYIRDRGFSSFEYCPGGPLEIDYLRRSTVDINDGRQSFGIQNTISLIQEGLNGNDYLVDSLKRRAESQKVGMYGLLEFVYNHKERIKQIVDVGREKLVSGNYSKDITIQSVNVGNGKKLELPLLSYITNRDTVVMVSEYRPIIKSLYDVKKPVGYLIPKELGEVVEWAKRHNLKTVQFNQSQEVRVEQYFVSGFDSIDFEGDTIINPRVEVKQISAKISVNDYLFIPTAQIKGNLVILALEPKSMMGLVTYNIYKQILMSKTDFPILRVVKE